MTQKYYFDGYDQVFLEEFDLDEMETQRVVTRTDNRTVSDDDARVSEVTSNGHEAYYIDISYESGAFCQENRVEKLMDAYRAAVRLGVTVPTAVLGDDWWALKAFEGKSLRKQRKGELVDALHGFDVQRFMWDTAKLFVLGYKDATVFNILMDETGVYRHIDLQSMNRSIAPDFTKFVYPLTGRFTALNLPPEAYTKMERRAVALAHHLKETQVIAEYTSEEIHGNIDTIIDEFPINRVESFSTEELPRVDETVIPPESTVNPVLDAL